MPSEREGPRDSPPTVADDSTATLEGPSVGYDEISSPLGRASIVGLSVMVASVTFVMLGLGLSPESLGLLGIILMLLLMLLGVPIAAAMGVSGAIGITGLQGARGLGSLMARLPYDAVAQWGLSVLPMFILMGLMLWRSGATDHLYKGAEQWLSWMPGGLAVTTNTAGAALASASGSTLGIAYALGRIAIPAQLAAGYPKKIALSSVLMAGSGGNMIPPSIMLVVFAGIANTPVGLQLLAGAVPGVVLVTGYGLVLMFGTMLYERSSGERVLRGHATWEGRFRSLTRLWPVPLIVVAVVGGLYAGVVTATEAGALGAAVALSLVVWYQRRQAPKQIWKAASETLSSVGALFYLLIGASIFTRFLAFTGLTIGIAETVQGWGLTRWQFLLVLVLLYLVLGMFMEPVSMMLLTVPVLLPVLPALDINVMWFGVFVTLMGEVAIITPPVGLLLYVVHGLAQEDDVRLGQTISLQDVMRASFFFLPAVAGAILILVAIPELATFLPDLAR